MAAADLRIAVLECVIATQGEPTPLEKFYFFRARPEHTNILVNANIDVVLTANDHAGDYGRAALLEQQKYLDAAGINYVGSGKNLSEAFAPLYKRVGDIVLAIFSVDTKISAYAATATEAGTAYLPPDNLELWQETFADRIRDAHTKADVVIVAPNWGEDRAEKPSEQTRKLAHMLIDLGADAILGCNSHVVQGVENYKERPIIYDTSSFLVDSGRRSGTGCFTLNITANGVEKVNFIPLVKRAGQILRAINSAPEIIKNFLAACEEFKHESLDSGGGIVAISFAPPPRESKIVNDFAEGKREKNLVEPLAEARPEWIVNRVPDEAIIPPQRFGPLKLVGLYLPPESRILTKRELLFVETYWTIDEPLDKDYLLSTRAVPQRECRVTPYGYGQAHEFLDSMWPVNRWKPGVIYRERFGLRPPEADRLANVPLRVQIKVILGEDELGSYTFPDLIKMKITGLRYPYYDIDFDDIIYQSEPGKCWTAEQLAKVTGGKWIVPPPKDFYIQYFSNVLEANPPHPNLLRAGVPRSLRGLVEHPDKYDAAMLTRVPNGLAENFPLLKVDNVETAMWKLGFAARKRFQGKVIAVTGSAGKTTTCNMLSHVFGKDHKLSSTPGSSNVYSNVPRIFARAKQDDAFAIIEMSINALGKLAGSVTYYITPNIAVVTSIAPAHTGALNVLAAIKRNIFCGMSPGGYAVLNRDMPYYELFEQKALSYKLKIITFGTHPDATVRMPVIENDGEFFIAGKAYKLSCPVPVDQLYDALAVVGVSLAVGFSVEKTLEYLQDFMPVEGRGNIIKSVRDGKHLTIINSTFNANPESIKYALQHVKNIEPNQKSRVAVLGDIAELGNKSNELHEGLAEAMLAAEPDRLLLCGEHMHYPYEIIKDKLNVTWFKTLDELLENVESFLRDGDTVLVKSSHSTGLSKVVDLLSESTAPAESPTNIPPDGNANSAEVVGAFDTPPPTADNLRITPLNVPQAFFDVRNFLPEGITPELNGRIPADKLKRVHCGGYLYVDAARAWLAMVRAAAQDGLFLSLNQPFQAYRKIETQIAVFKKRFVPVTKQEELRDGAIRVEYDGKIWQLNPGTVYAAIPGTSSHCYGLAVDIQNIGNSRVKAWIDKNAESFGFVKEYSFEPWHYTYVKGREGIPARVLEIESLPPEPTYTAEEIQRLSGCQWLKPPPEGWTCNGIFYKRPIRAGQIAVVNQGDGAGIDEKLAQNLHRQLAGFICVNPEPFAALNRPILVTTNTKDTVEKISAEL